MAKSISKMTVPELKEYADALDPPIVGISNLSKAQLLAAIEKFMGSGN